MSERSQLDVVHPLHRNDPAAFRILCVGDSITCHGCNEDTKSRLGWSHVSGMAASSEASDYAHLLQACLRDFLKPRPVELYFHTFGGSGSVRQRLSALEKVAGTEPHLVVIQLGEHERESDGAQSLADSYGALLDRIRKFESRPLVIATGVWQPGPAYAGWPAMIDRVFSQVCAARGVPFVSVEDLACDPANYGHGVSPGVRWHPNDRGHAGYAERIFAVWRAIIATTIY